MDPRPLLLYKASAGSGKTYLLAGTYIRLLIRDRDPMENPEGFTRILALTFTNKATGEMKSRILANLETVGAWPNGPDKEKAAQLIRYLQQDPKLPSDAAEIAKRCRNALSLILHRYSSFAVSTIDAFFQKVLRSFVLEAGLSPDYGITLDQTEVLLHAMDALIAKVPSDKSLRRWFIRLIRQEIDQGRNFNYRHWLLDMGRIILSESFKRLSREEKAALADTGRLERFIQNLRDFCHRFEKNQGRLAQKGLHHIKQYGLDTTSFKGGSRSFMNFLPKLANGPQKATDRDIPQGMEKAVGAPDAWYSQKSPDISAIEALYPTLNPILETLVQYTKSNLPTYIIALRICDDLPRLGLLSHYIDSINTWQRESRTFHLQEAFFLIRELTQNNDTPFLLERFGTRFQSFLLDEFQDTSVMQWESLKPLLTNGLAAVKTSLIVGDVKQSIYRWRNGDWRILGEQIQNDGFLSPYVCAHTLQTNWRSAPEIVNFNNAVIPCLVEIFKNLLPEEAIQNRLSEAYNDYSQTVPAGKSGGYVRFADFYPQEQDGIVLSPEAQIMDLLPQEIEEALLRGHTPSDILILVRRKSEGRTVLKALKDYAAKHPECHQYEIVTEDTLSLSDSPHIQLITSLFAAALNPEDKLARARIRHFATLTLQQERPGLPPFSPEDLLPLLRTDSLTAAMERLLGSLPWASPAQALPFLEDFYDLLRRQAAQGADLYDFCKWWTETGSDKAVQSAQSPDALRLMTIHKSKGLEAPVVFIPLCNWYLSTRDIVWAHTRKPPFDPMPVLPVRPDKYLTESPFHDDYMEECYLSCMDSLNMYYVAATRPAQELYIYANHSNGRNDDRYFAKHLADAVKKAFPDASSPYDIRKGDPARIRQAENKTDAFDYQLDSIPSKACDKLPKLKIEASFSWSEDDSARQWGIVLHKALARMHTAADAPQVLDALTAEGELKGDKATVAGYAQRIREALEQPTAAEWFDGTWIVHNEASIVMPLASNSPSRLLRPDRVMEKEGNIVVVDYKFGSKHLPAYRNQLNRYAQALRNMGYAQVEAHIWYVLEKKIETLPTS